MISFDQLLLKIRGPIWNPPERLLALDPGETVGWALFVEGKLEDHGQQQCKENPVQGLITIMENTMPTAVVAEDYKIYEHKLKDHKWSELFTSQMLGSIKTLAQLKGITVATQLANSAKGFCTDDKLKEWGYYIRGMRHSRDAIRHGLYYLLFNKRVIGSTEHYN